MSPEEVATLPVGRPVLLVDQRYGRIVGINVDAGLLRIEAFEGNASLGVRPIPFSRIDRLRPDCEALIETA